MKVGLAQISPFLGNLEKNLDIHLEYMEKAHEEKLDLLVFPELSLTGYTLKDITEEIALDPNASPEFKKIADASRGIAVVFGFVEQRGRGLYYNSAAFISGNKTGNIDRLRINFFPRGIVQYPILRRRTGTMNDWVKMCSSHDHLLHFALLDLTS